MKFMKRTGIYRAANVTFNPTTLEAYSYAWWSFVKQIEGKLVFNNFRYSVSTGRHQAKVRRLLTELGIKIDIELSLANGLQVFDSLEDLFLNAEEQLCDAYLENEMKREERNLNARYKRAAKKLENYLENEVHFRDYDIKQKRQFGHINKIAVHQIVENIEQDVQNALYNFSRDGFESVVFYV